MTIGMRNIKTAISVFLCIILARILKLEYPFYAVIAAIIAMQGSVTASFKVGRNRMLGTFIGAFIGLICALISPGNALLCGIGIIAVIYLCNLLKWNQSVSIACVVFLAIMLNLKNQSPILYSTNRLLDTFIGIIISMLVNYFIAPPENFNKMCLHCNEMLEEISNHIKDKIVYNRDIDLADLSSKIEALKHKLNTYVEDFKLKREQSCQIDNLNKIINLHSEIYAHLKAIDTLENVALNEHNTELINKFFTTSLIGKYKENSDTNIVYNYHVKQIMNCIFKIKNLQEECNKSTN